MKTIPQVAVIETKGFCNSAGWHQAGLPVPLFACRVAQDLVCWDVLGAEVDFLFKYLGVNRIKRVGTAGLGEWIFGLTIHTILGFLTWKFRGSGRPQLVTS